MKTKIEKYKIVMCILRLLYWSLSLMTIYMILLKITGHSPTTGDIALTLIIGSLGGFFTFAINISRQLGEIKSDVKHINLNLNRLIDKVELLSNDLKNHINDPYAHQRKKYITR